MANSTSWRDAYTLMEDLAEQCTGQTSIRVSNTKDFVSVGETVLRTGVDNVLNAISMLVSRTIISARPYRQKLDILRTTEARWGGQVRKVVPLYMGYEESQDANTDLNPTQLADGAVTHVYSIKNPKVVQLNFYGSQKLQKHITRYRDQLASAFQSEAEFMAFIDGVMIEYANEIELANENKARATLLNAMAGIINYQDARTIDLVYEYNQKNRTTYTRDDLFKAANISDFMKFVASEIKIYSQRLTDFTALYHSNITGYDPILRHTPKSLQKMVMYNPVFIEAESEVYSGLFNPEYLNIGDFEGVNFWQDPNDPTAIKILPNILNESTGASEDAANAIEQDFVLGMLFDEEALGILPQFDYTATTPLDAARGLWHIYSHWRFNTYTDYTENMIVFVLGAGGI